MTRQLTALLLLLLLLAGCAVSPGSRTETGEVIAPSAPQPSYEAEPGRDAATVAQMRAAPAPAIPTLEAAEGSANDENRLVAQGFVRIGKAYYPIDVIGKDDEAAARDASLRRGQEIGAERVLLYTPQGGENAAWIAAYYVRFKLPFGASFRDVNAQERQQLGRDGGVQIGSVISGTPASRANLIAGDFVLEIDGHAVADRVAFQDLLKRSAGHAVTLTIVRNGETLKRMVRLGAMPGADR
ncbi:MAG: PDZ domain-containing protein [Dokdonella sp.]